MIPGVIVLIVILSFVLVKSADQVVVAIRRLGKDSKSGMFAFSALLLALSTSFPELFVAITSAIEGSTNLIFGVVLGSNVANISLVAGLTALINGRIKVSSKFLEKDVSTALVAGVLPVILALDGNLNRVDGLILIAIYLAYATSFFRGRFLQIGLNFQDEAYIYRFLMRSMSLRSVKNREYGRLFVAVALLLFTADAIVRLSMLLSGLAGLGVFAVGLIIVAAGTSLPEFAFSLRSVEDNEPTMFFGNILGSVIVNSTLVIGIAAFIKPVQVASGNGFIFASVVFLVIFLTFWYFIRSKFRLDRWEGALLLLIYTIFILVEIYRV